MEDQRPHRGYSHAHASRLASKPSTRTPPKKPDAASKRATTGKRSLVNDNTGPCKSLVDAFKQHGMKLCDGTKLNAVGKSIECIGSVPPAVSASITALFLSQNNLRILDGIEQFTSSLRLLSIGGNLLTLFSEIERLTKLPRLRNLNLLGNPICDHPNYRFRVIDALKQVQVLDTVDVTAKERELASIVASQDKALRAMVLRNHFEIQQLQLIAQLITLRSDFYGFVLAHAASSTSLFVSFDRIPNPHEAQVDVAMLLRLWKYDQRLSESELEALEIQMGTIVMRTHHKLAEHPKLRAKEFLLQLGGAKRAKKQAMESSCSSRNVAMEIRNQSASSWQKAFESVIALQQQTIANLQGLCERNNRELVAALKTLLTTDPTRRRQLVNARWAENQSGVTVRPAGELETRDRRRLSGGSVLAAPLRRKKQLLLPPQQQDPDQYGQRESLSDPQQGKQTHAHQVYERREDTSVALRRLACHQQQQQEQQALQQRQQQQSTNASRTMEIRNGEFTNQTLSETVHHFKLREPPIRSAPLPPVTSYAASANASAGYSHLKQLQVFTIQHESPANVEGMALKAQAAASFAEAKTASYPVTNEKASANFAFDDGDAQEGHGLAVLMNHQALDSKRRRARARQHALAVDESVETASSISSFSDASSFWRGSRVASAAERKEAHASKRISKADEPSPPPEASSIELRDARVSTNSQVPQDPASGFGARHHELEDREAKYIKALIESEQRELELRNQLTTFKRKLSQHQRSMAQELQEREQIKSEVNERVQHVAAPKVLRRFFVRWIHFYHWSLQLTHLQTRRCFISQHDWFWRWRRKVWVQQRLRAICAKVEARTVQRHFGVWLSLSRLTVTIKFTRAKHERQRIGELFLAWRQGAKKIQRLKLAEDCRTQEQMVRFQRGCFQQWASLTRHRRHLKTAMTLHSRRLHQALKEITFCRWKLVVLVHARPLRAKLELFVSSKQSQHLRQLFMSWHKLVKGDKLYFQHLKHRVWRHWTHRFRCEKAERETVARSRRLVLKDRIQSWRVVTQDRIASRRALSLAKRYVNQRRLRKLWLYWKCYTFAKRKYVQGSTKALKHYFVKILRSSWLTWKRKTRKNVLSVKEQKHSDLRHHFQALRTGVKLSIAAKCRARLLRHLRTRCDRSLVHQWLLRWRGVVRRRRQAKQSHQVLLRQTKRALLQRSWTQWLASYLGQVRAKFQSAGQQYEQVISEKHELEVEVLRVNGRVVTMTEQLQSFEGSIRDQEREIATYQSDLLHSKELRVALEKKLKALEDSHVQERQQWAAMESQLNQQRAIEQQQARAIAEGNNNLQRQIQELQTKLIEEQQHNLEANHKTEVSRQELSKAQLSHETEVAQLTSAHQKLEQCVEELKLQLQDEQQQKEETANRLQEYEARLATTCADINQHEEAHERENARLRSEREQLEARVSEEQARNAELQRLVKEKNALIHQLNQQQVAQKSHDEYQPATAELRHGNGYDSREGEPVSPSLVPHSGLQQAHKSQNSGKRRDNTALAGAIAHCSVSESTIGSLLKDINQSILVRAGMMEMHLQPEHQHNLSTADAVPTSRRHDDREWCAEHERVGEPVWSYAGQSSVTLNATNNRENGREVDERIDEQASKVHEDIRKLQMRIANRLKQTPTSTGATHLRSPRRDLVRFQSTSPSSSSTSLSEEESNLTETEVVRPRAGRRAEDTGRAQASQSKRGDNKLGGVARGPRKALSSENVSKAANTIPKRPSLHSSTLLEPMRGGPAAMKKRLVTTASNRKVPRMQHGDVGGERENDVRRHDSSGNTMEEQRAPDAASGTEGAPRPAGDSPSLPNAESSQVSLAPSSSSGASPGKSNAASSDKKQTSSSTKQFNKLNIDPNATLAAISAKLSTIILPAESEIVRINREALLTVSRRYQQQVSKDKAHDRQQLAQLNEQEGYGDNTLTGSTTGPIQASSPQNSPNRQRASAVMGIPSALHESIIAEEWVNVHLETNGTFLLPATDIEPLLQKTSAAFGLNSDDAYTEDEAFAFRKKGSDSGPLGRAGIDRTSLYRLGMPKDLVDRLYRALYVYTNGFHNIINEIAAHCPPLAEKHVSSNVWLTFLLLLEQCENGKYEMAMLKFKQATQAWRRQMQEEHFSEKTRLESQLLTTRTQLSDEAMRSAEKSELIAKLASDAVSASQTISEQQHELAAQAEQLRLLRLEILVHEDDERQLNDQLDDTRKDFEVANSERINALAERFALEEEMRKLQGELERVDAEKANYAKRMHEGLFMNQALRATNETLKQNAVVLVMEKDKVGNEKDGLQAHIECLQQEVQELKLQKVHVERELLDSQRKTQHLDARIETMKEQIEIEAVVNTKQIQEITFLKGEIDEEKVKAGVLEAKCNLLTAEKQNTGMRAQDKLRIERLLNQKLELENAVEVMKLERTKDQEHIWNLRASLEALDTEMQHSKRVFSAGQQAFLHSERTCEQLRNQLQDVEKSYEKATKNLASLKERFKLFEENSKDQITNLEVELKVMNAQLREVSYANRDNTALIAELNKSLEVSSKELKSVKNRLEVSETNFNHLKNEKEDLQRERTQRELQRSTSKNAIEMFVRSLQHILKLVKLDEYPFDEALRELLRLTQETFGKELDIDKVLDDEDEAEEFVEELDDADVVDEQRTRRKLKKKGLLLPDSEDSEVSGETGGNGEGGEGGDGDGQCHQTQMTSMSKFRKSKLDKQVKKLQRDAENKAELVQALEGVICEQADQLAQLTRTNELHEKRLELNENQKGLLNADIDATAIVLYQIRTAKKHAEKAMQQAESDRDVAIERTMQMQLALENIRRQFDRQEAMHEDLLAKIWREYEHYLLMLSLRREKASQAVVTTAEQCLQTLVPQRNPATERARIASKYMPAANPQATTFENVIQQINNNARVLLPEVANDISLLHFSPRQHDGGLMSGGNGERIYSAVPVVHPAHRVGGGGRMRRETDSSQYRNRYEHTCAKQLTELPALDQQPLIAAAAANRRGGDHPPPHIIRHVNEFGVRQDVLISPVYPSYFQDGTATGTLQSSPRHGTLPSSTLSKIPRKPEQQHRHRRQLQLSADQDDERCNSPRQPAFARDSRRRFPRGAGKRRAMTDAAVKTVSSESVGDTGLRYHRGFLRTGMEVLRSGGHQQQQEFPEDEDDDDSDDDNSDDSLAMDDDNGRHKSGRMAGSHAASLSPRSPGRLEEAIREYQKELGDEALARQAQQPRFTGYEKDDQVRSLAHTRGVDDSDDGFSLDADMVQELGNSRFVPAVLYPLLPPQ